MRGNIDKDRLGLLSGYTGSGDACSKCHSKIRIDLPARSKPQFFLDDLLYRRGAGGPADKHHFRNFTWQQVRVLQSMMDAIKGLLQVGRNHFLVFVTTEFRFEVEIVVNEFFADFDERQVTQLALRTLQDHLEAPHRAGVFIQKNVVLPMELLDNLLD